MEVDDALSKFERSFKLEPEDFEKVNGEESRLNACFIPVNLVKFRK